LRAAGRAPSRAVGRAGVLPRVQPRERRTRTRVGSVRRTAMMSTNSPDTLIDRCAPLEMSGDRFRSLGHDLVDQIADWLERLPDGPVMRDESPVALRRALNADASLPDAGSDAGVILD